MKPAALLLALALLVRAAASDPATTAILAAGVAIVAIVAGFALLGRYLC